MNRLTQHLLLVLLGGVTLRVSLGEGYLAFVQAGFRPLLIAAGAVVLAVGVIGVLRARPGTDDVTPARRWPGCCWPRSPYRWWSRRWASAPTTPGSPTARSRCRATPSAPSRATPHPWRDATSGWSASCPRREGGGWYVTRIRIACCAADASAVRVVLDGEVAGAADRWVEVVGHYTPSLPHPTEGHPEPAITPDTVRPVPAPADGYEA